MIIIAGKKDSIFERTLGTQAPGEQPMRWSRFVLFEEVEGGTLLYNALTRVLAFSEYSRTQLEDAASLSDAQAWYDCWFLVPQDCDEMKLADQLNRILAIMNPGEKKSAVAFEIYTTTACNARCPYCFQKDYQTVTMSEETARRVAKYIAGQAGGETVRLGWFGGEPLVNHAAMDWICGSLADSGVDYRSTITTNGFLWTPELIEKAVKSWKLQRAQVTLDGTEEVYNACKNYVGATGSPYRRVLDNIGALLEAGIAVSVRLNLTLENADNLLTLVDEVSARFAKDKHFSIYSHELFEYDSLSTGDSWPGEGQLLDAYRKLIAHLDDHGYHKSLRRYEKWANHCMADSERCFVVSPVGALTKCKHYFDQEIVGNVDEGVTNPALVRAWKERPPKSPLCDACPLYPACIRLTKCPDVPAECSRMLREIRQIDCRFGMISAWQKWKEQKKDV